MKTKFSIKIETIAIAIIIVMMVLLSVFSDDSDVESTQRIEVSLEPCELVDGVYSRVQHFRKMAIPYICGEILTEYLPLHLDYVVVDVQTEQEVFDGIQTFDDKRIIIRLPNNLRIGTYQFTLRTGRRRVIQTTYFEVVE